MDVCQEITVPPMSARAFPVGAGQLVRIVDIEGGQPGDFVAFKADDLSVKLSQARTRVENGTVAVTRGHRVWTNRLPPEAMFRIVGDTGGPHDLLYPACCRYALALRFGVTRDGCFENLAKALQPLGVKPSEIPDPLNLFFRVAVDAAGGMKVSPPGSAPGSMIELRAEFDCLVAVSTCSVPFQGRACSGYRIQVLAPPSAPACP